ncbi:hypothetical protein ACC862_38095, partial [Rhizobium ruizarguesonis]
STTPTDRKITSYPIEPARFFLAVFSVFADRRRLRSCNPEEEKVKKSRARQYEVNESKHFINHNDALMHPGRTD